jgi:hypothetical protein
MFVKLVGNNVIQYPSDPKSENPNVSFPDNWNGGVVDGYTYSYVQTPGAPSVNLGWIAVSTNTIYKEGNSWYTAWESKLAPQEELESIIANKRYQVEVGGIAVNGYIYSTDRDSQTKYVGVSLNIDQLANADSFSINWKVVDINYPSSTDVKNTFVTLNASQFKNVANLVFSYVQKAFNKEAYYLNLIRTSNTEVLKQVDFNSGWPTNGEASD